MSRPDLRIVGRGEPTRPPVRPTLRSIGGDPWDRSVVAPIPRPAVPVIRTSRARAKEIASALRDAAVVVRTDRIRCGVSYLANDAALTTMGYRTASDRISDRQVRFLVPADAASVPEVDFNGQTLNAALLELFAEVMAKADAACPVISMAVRHTSQSARYWAQRKAAHAILAEWSAQGYEPRY